MKWYALRKGLGMLCVAFLMFNALCFISCSEVQEHTAPAINDRDSVSMMTTYGVNTLISDSGVIKYKIVAERWDVNTIKNPPRWTFEKGIFMEQFDEQFHVEGYVYADSAWYYDQQKLWELRGRVRILNVNGLRFNSEELYWDGIRHEFYSNKFSRVVTPERTMEGTYFRSDEHMTHYTVTNSAGSFQASDMESSEQEQQSATSSASSNTTTPTDTAQSAAPPVRQAATRHSATTKNSSYKQ